MESKVKILSPVGSFASLESAIDAGADAIYFGVEEFNMRSKSSQNFSLDDLDAILSKCHKIGIKCYVTVNSVIYNEELVKVKTLLDKLKKKNVDAVIAHDIAILNYAKKIGLTCHISTQANVSNIEAVKFYANFADTIVLARELNLDQIKSICKTVRKEQILGPSQKLLKIEIFIHGAMCVAISGKCYMSLAQYNMSANRGKCLQACRRRYLVKEEETGKELIIDNKYIMSPKDLCTIDFLEQIIDTGVDILKIEGRARTADYVSIVTKTYKNALNAISLNNFTKDKKEAFKTHLKTVYNRGFWSGYFLGNDNDGWAKTYGSKATLKKVYLGRVTNYFSKINVLEMLIESTNLEENNKIVIIGEKTGSIFHVAKNIKNHSNSNLEENKKTITFHLPQTARRNDKVYALKQNDS